MDLLKLLQSFEDLLFELLSWIIYYPLTLWRVITRPLKMIRYSNHEQTESAKERYTDTLSPPLFLLITIALMHLIELATGGPGIARNTAIARAITASDENLIVARSVLFALLPLFAAWRHVVASGHPVERKYLRPVFYGQCYLAAVYTLMIALAITFGREPVIGFKGGAEAFAFLATLWYLVVQTRQFRLSLGITTLRAAGLAIRAYVEAVITFILAALAIAGAL
ncbi:hypothetical protein [Polymorphobacter sp.]|uniref:hypothetical protein n=1 Tax=Polymorphobacter sp. TaxID=1909290 RepID=UPI003F710323